MCRNKIAGIVAVFFTLCLIIISCDEATGPDGNSFKIIAPKDGVSFDMGTQVTVKWTLPEDGSIEKVIVYQARDGQDWEPMNQYTPVSSPTDTFLWYIGSDNPGRPPRLKIQNQADSTQNDEKT